MLRQRIHPRLWCTCGTLYYNQGNHQLNCPFERVTLFDSIVEWWEIEGEQLYNELLMDQPGRTINETYSIT